MSPFKSLAQEGYMHEHPEILGSKLKEWDAATKGKELPKRKPSYREVHEKRKKGESASYRAVHEQRMNAE